MGGGRLGGLKHKSPLRGGGGGGDGYFLDLCIKRKAIDIVSYDIRIHYA